MKTETKQPKAQETSIEAAEKAISYVPLGNASEITLTIAIVRKFLATRTKSGKEPSDADIVKFMMLCKVRQLDPWQGDAYLIGYDSDQGPTFTLITAHQALAKRSELNKDFDGLESGVIVKVDDSGPVFREGDFTLEGEKLLGGWAKVYRRDRSKPFYQALKVGTYDTQKSRWNKDKAGMIVKCAEAGAYRAAFPTQLGGMYTQEERATIQSAGELPDMTEGKHEFGFRLVDQVTTPNPEPEVKVFDTDEKPGRVLRPEVDENGNVFHNTEEGFATMSGPHVPACNDPKGPEAAAVHEPEQGRVVDEPIKDIEARGGIPAITDGSQPAEKAEAAAEPSKADQRFAMLIEHVAATAELTLDRAEKVALRWLKRYYPKTSMAFQDQRFDTLIWPKAKKLDWKKEAAA